MAHLQDWESLSEDPARPGQQGAPAQQEVSCHLGGSKSFPWGALQGEWACFCALVQLDNGLILSCHKTTYWLEVWLGGRALA